MTGHPSRTARRVVAVATATSALLLGAGVSSAAADPWLSWGVTQGVSPKGRVDSQVYTADAVVGTRTPLAEPRSELAADFSDDGDTAAYLTQVIEPGRSRYSYRLVVHRRDGSAIPIPATRVSGRPDVSADGTTVTFGRVNGSVQTFDVASRTVTTLCTACSGLPKRLKPEISNVALSPDGRHVAIQSYSQGDAQALLVYRTADAARVTRLTFGEGEPDDTMAWTADSSHLGFVELGSLGGPDFTAVWRVVLLGLDGTRTNTALTAEAPARLSGPMRLGDTWYVVRSAVSAPTARNVTLLSTPSLDAAAQPVGVIATRGKAKRILPFVGLWAVTSSRPTPAWE